MLRRIAQRSKFQWRMLARFSQEQQGTEKVEGANPEDHHEHDHDHEHLEELSEEDQALLDSFTEYKEGVDLAHQGKHSMALLNF